jgi:hypothetical protein
MPIPNCDTGLQPSRIPGNIGTLKSKIMIWDHDPFWARPTQIMSWPFSKDTARQMQEVVPDAIFEMGTAFLRPALKHHDMFVCTLNPNKEEPEIEGPPAPGTTSANSQVDFVGSSESGVGQIAQPRMPGGAIYKCNGGKDEDECQITVDGTPVTASDPSTGRDIFPHQVWRHRGSLLNGEVLIHPSDYQKSLPELKAAAEDEIDIPELLSAAKWDYIEVADNGKLSIWPIMITKQSPDFGNSVHWTLEKWTPIWQGQDFFVTVRLGDKRTDDTKDPNTGSSLSMVPPYDPFFRYNLEKNEGEEHFPGITNQAFHVFPQRAVPGSGRSQDELDKEATRAAREAYDWRYKTYIMVEVGVHDPLHNYFIELRKGSKPRFLHLGEEWDNPKRLEQGVNADPNADNAGFDFYKKCRELSVYEHLKTDQLFKQKDFKFSVRNHLGRIVITFEGYEGQPWVIRRIDNDPRETNFNKVLIPMIVPSAPVRIHGGNISCAVNYTPTEYMPFATIPFVNRQVDTGPDTSDRADDEDVYLTFSHMGNAVQYTKDSVKDTYFNDPRFLYEKVGYDCDAFLVHEKNKNATTQIRIYEEYDEQYRLYGKGWYNKTPRTNKDWEVQRNEDTQLPLAAENINGMSEDGGTPSHLRIVNARDPTKEFPLSLDEPISGHYEWKEYIAVWDVGIELQAGSIKLSPPSGTNALPVNEDFEDKVFENYVTPIATSWRLIILGGGKPFEDSVIPFDISPLVSHVSDSWSAEDFHSLSHEMQIECYIPIESTSGVNPRDEQDPNLINIFNLGRKLLPLHDKSFYVTVSYWWENGVGHRWVEANIFNVEGENPNFNDVLIQMTGVAYGAQLTRSNNLLTMSFTVKDYMSVLENQLLFNSPFFDAVQDVQAVYELGKLAGLADESSGGLGVDRRPLGYLRKVMNDGDRVGDRLFTYNGEKSRSERFDLPGTYASLAEPSVKFQNGESYENAVKRIAQLAGKTVYFDRWGVLRLETPAALTAVFSSANEDIEFTPVFDFVSTPIVRTSNIPDPGEGGTEDFVFDPTVHAAHLVYNALTYQRSVEECANQIIIMSASNDIRNADGSRTGGFIVEGYTFFDQIWKPESEGFIGYRKPLYQQEGAFGSVQGVRNAIGIYAKKKFPPVIMSFETYGVPGLKALDIITLDGNLGYITEIAHDLDPATNRWWMNITAEWLKPFKGELGFLETIEPGTGGEG